MHFSVINEVVWRQKQHLYLKVWKFNKVYDTIVKISTFYFNAVWITNFSQTYVIFIIVDKGAGWNMVS